MVIVIDSDTDEKRSDNKRTAADVTEFERMTKRPTPSPPIPASVRPFPSPPSQQECPNVFLPPVPPLSDMDIYIRQMPSSHTPQLPTLKKRTGPATVRIPVQQQPQQQQQQQQQQPQPHPQQLHQEVALMKKELENSRVANQYLRREIARLCGPHQVLVEQVKTLWLSNYAQSNALLARQNAEFMRHNTELAYLNTALNARIDAVMQEQKEASAECALLLLRLMSKTEK